MKNRNKTFSKVSKILNTPFNSIKKWNLIIMIINFRQNMSYNWRYWNLHFPNHSKFQIKTRRIKNRNIHQTHENLTAFRSKEFPVNKASREIFRLSTRLWRKLETRGFGFPRFDQSLFVPFQRKLNATGTYKGPRWKIQRGKLRKIA